ESCDWKGDIFFSRSDHDRFHLKKSHRDITASPSLWLRPSKNSKISDDLHKEQKKQRVQSWDVQKQLSVLHSNRADLPRTSDRKEKRRGPSFLLWPACLPAAAMMDCYPSGTGSRRKALLSLFVACYHSNRKVKKTPGQADVELW
ncbi:hypothetical protein LEMLEM_LOCUS24375, partial [Lemmus lemmus]